MSSKAGAQLWVFLEGRRVGQLERRGPARYRFTYEEAALRQDTSGVILSASLPTQETTFPPARTAPFFEGLLPEGSVRTSIARSFRLSEEDGFGLLEELGSDCAGAVAVLPPGQKPAADTNRLRHLSEDELGQLVEELPRHPLGVDTRPGGVRLSLGGIQRKLVLAGTPGNFSQPLGGTPSNCLLKPDPSEYEDLAANENFCMRVAAAVGLRVPWTELVRVGSISALFVSRFDRRFTENRYLRVHQEDMCQAMGILPAAKYEENGGPSIAQVIALLRALRGPFMARDINDFVHATMVNFFLGNSDAHGKNFALLHERGSGPRLAPLYDIVSTCVYPEVTDRMAMSIGGVDDPGAVDLDAWNRLADACGLGGGMRALLRRRATEVLRAAELLRGEASFQGWHRPVIDSIVRLCRERAARFIS